MITAWTKHLKDPGDKVKFEKSVKHSGWVLEHLSTLVSELENDLSKSEISIKTYDSPNWDYKQAHYNGYRECLSKIQKLINLDVADKQQQKEKEIDRQPVTVA